MVQRYLPKIKMGTAKGVAKDLLSTKGGKKLSDTKFKQFMKKDKDLQHYYTQSSSLSKFQAKKFFTKVVGSAQTNAQLKVSRLAQKMGIKGDNAKQLPGTVLERVYRRATTEQIAAEPKPTGPTPEEQRQQARREKMLKSLHKQQRAEEISKDQPAQPTPAKANENRQAGPVITPGSGTTVTQLHGATAPKQTGVTMPKPAAKTNSTPKCIVFPIENVTPNVEGLELLLQKINRLLIQTLQGSGMFQLVSPQGIGRAVTALSLETTSLPSDRGAIRTLAERLNAEYYVTGSIKKIGATTDIVIELCNIENDRRLYLATIHEIITDPFELERKIHWEIINALQGDEDATAPPASNQDTVQDLPI